MPLLKIKKLHASIGKKPILKGVSLDVGRRETHAIMGPNGSGKSTLANILLNHPGYTITGGSITFCGKKITGLSTDKIARLGIFLAFQYPQSISGVSVANLLKVAGLKQASGKHAMNLNGFTTTLRKRVSAMQLPDEFLTRSLNEGFSGGEKKKAEILQLSMLKPKLAILDETDSGLDVDSLKLVSNQIVSLQKQNVSILIITHYNRILHHVKPDYVHVMHEGKIVKSGGKKLAVDIERRGYGSLLKNK